ncbi:MAG: hypothetical protein HBSAPP03_27350 [Phycisphaerae bacterium]|nr:MAG: hypothetical protein HBSAPP03_27350 [Phycisphaerae bacterium]
MKRASWLGAAALVLFTQAGLATPPTDDQIGEALTKLSAPPAEGQKARPRAELAKEAFKDLSLGEATLAQLERLNQARVFPLLTDQAAAIRTRLAELTGDRGLDGVKAYEMLLAASSRPTSMDAEGVKAYRTQVATTVAGALAHPALTEALSKEIGLSIVSSIGGVAPEQFKAAGLLPLVEKVLKADLPPRAAMAMVGVFDTIADDDFGADRATIDRVRLAVNDAIERSLPALTAELERAEAALAAVPAGDEADGQRAAATSRRDMATRMIQSAGRSMEYLTGAYARGELVGHPAPNIAFTWSTLGEMATSLSDLKGKVVVLDFWATWCGPCIASFPNIRQLQARYEGFPVVILGVTSLQGYHIDQKATDPKNRRIDTKDNPAKEYELMPGFMKDLEMTWAVAFGETNVFNPQYGVRGIPHVAIIDPAGVVRFRGLHPGGDPAEEAEKIDGLLKEFKLPMPASPMPSKNAKDEKPGG